MPNDRNFLEDLLVASPFVGGSAFAIRTAAQAGAFNIPKQSFLSRMTADVQKGTTSAMDMSLMNEMSTYFRSKEGAEIARRAWIEAVQSTNPLANEVLSFAGDIKTTPYNKVYTSIEQTLLRNNSIFMASTRQKFKQNIGLLNKQMKIGGIPEFEKVQGLKFPPAANVAVNELPPELQAFRQTFLKGTGVTGTGVEYYTRKGWQQEGFGTYVMGFKHKGERFSVTVPMSKGGVLVEGLAQSSKRVAPGAHIYDVRGNLLERLSRHEYYLKDIEKSIIPGIAEGEYRTARDIQSALGGIYERDIYALENIPNVPPGMRNEALESYQRIRGQAIDIRIAEQEAYRIPTGAEVGRIMEGGEYFPSTSPKNIAAGRLSTYDPRGWSLTPEDVSFARRPGQALRRWRMTPDAVKEFMNQGSRWSIFETQAWRKDFGNYAAPHIRTLYVDPEKYATQLEQLGLKDGESIITGTPQVRRMLEASRIADPLHFKTVAKGLEERIVQGAVFEPGEILGWTPEGEGVAYRKGMDLLGVESFETMGKGQFKSVFYTETHRPGIAAKRFGASAGFKAMEKFVDPLAVESAVVAMTAGMAPEQRAQFFNFKEPLRIVAADELRKDASKKNTQIITGIWDRIHRTRTEDAIRRNGKLASFMRNPNVFASYISGKHGTGEGFIRGMEQFALGAGLKPHEMSAIFGESGLSLGVSQAVFGGTMRETGAGTLGSIEPRAFDLLRAGQYGPLGEDIAGDLARRVSETNPRALATYEALTQTLQSVAGQISPERGARVWDLAERGYGAPGFQSWIEEGGGWLKAGKKDIFVPGGDVLTPYMTATGKSIRGDVSNIYHTLARELSATKNADLLEADESIKKFIGGITEQQAPFGKGAGAFYRGKLTGSRFLTGLSKVGTYTSPSPWVAGVPEELGLKMFEELGPEAGAMAERFKAGEVVGSVLTRHPFTGPYSLQPIGIQMMKGVSDPVISLPSFTASIRLAGEKAANPIELSPMIGLAGDLDADIYSVSLVSPDVEQKISKQFLNQNNELTQAYMEHSVRSQIIKARAGAAEAEGMTTLRTMVADARKLGATQEWVPLLSTDLGVARKEVSERLTGQRAANAMFMLGWLEQVLISGKHIPASRIEEMPAMFKTIQESIRARSAIRMEGVVKNIVGENELARKLLTEDVKIAEGLSRIQSETGVKMRDVLPAVPIRQTTEDIMSALEMSQVSGMEDMARMATGRKAPTIENLGKYLAYTGAATGGAVSRVGANISKASMTAKNFLASAGLGVLKHKKAVGFGFAGSIALATVLSKPDSLVGPGAGMISNAKPVMNVNKGGSQIKPEDMQPPPQSLGNPSPPSRLMTPTVRMNPGQSMGMDVKVRGKMDRDFTRKLGMTTKADRINVNVRDNSSSLSQSAIVDRILK